MSIISCNVGMAGQRTSRVIYMAPRVCTSVLLYLVLDAGQSLHIQYMHFKGHTQTNLDHLTNNHPCFNYTMCGNTFHNMQEECNTILQQN